MFTEHVQIIPFIKHISIACLHQVGVSTKQTAAAHWWFAREADKCLFTESKSLVGNASCLVRDAAVILFACVCVAINTHTHTDTLTHYVMAVHVCIYIVT